MKSMSMSEKNPMHQLAYDGMGKSIKGGDVRGHSAGHKKSLSPKNKLHFGHAGASLIKKKGRK